jgi:hypothetical protein
MARIPPRAPQPVPYRSTARQRSPRRAEILRHPALKRAQARAQRRLRAVLIGLHLFLAATTLAGGLFVVPALPVEWFNGTPFPGPLIPAIALTGVGIASLLAAGLLVARPGPGAVASLATGGAISAFEVVQVLTISLGDWLRPLGIDFGHRVLADGEPFGGPLWLQPFYFAVGLIIVAFAWRLIPRRVLDELQARLPALERR